jgi:hypothetical protein
MHANNKAKAAILRQLSSIPALKCGDDGIVYLSASGALEYYRLPTSSWEARLALYPAIRKHCDAITAHTSNSQKVAITSAMEEFGKGERTIKQALSITALSNAVK